MIKGITILLLQKTQIGVDDFNAPVYSEEWVPVDNVLVGQPSSDDIVSDLQLYGKTLAYTIAIPKGDDHEWTDTKVQFFGKTFSTYGLPVEGIERMIPLSWNKQVKVELYE